MIDIDKFIASLLHQRRFLSDNENGYIIAALKEQGLEFRDGNIKDILEDAVVDSNEDGLIADTIKQGEQKPTQEIEPFETEHGKYYYCIKDYFCGGKKQASKGDVIQALRGLPIMGLKDASEYFLPVNYIKCNSAWSEEDEEKVKAMCEDGNLKPSERAWLKSLKERVQPMQEWSEEDEVAVKDICDKLNRLNMSYVGNESIICQEEIKWLKSLRPQNWKPSKEQMNTLEYYMHTLVCNEYKEILFGLYADLKKLMEE